CSGIHDLSYLPSRRSYYLVAQAAVDRLGRRRRGVSGQVVLLAQDHLQAAPAQVTGDARAVDAATDPQHVAMRVMRSIVRLGRQGDRKSTRLHSSHVENSFV